MNTGNKNSNLLGKNWKLVNFCEFDKYAIKSYCAIHNVNESLNIGDITKVDETKIQPFNMICGGSPCQDFSVAYKQKGSIWTCKDCKDEEGKSFTYNPLRVHWSKRDKCPCCGSNNIEKTRSSLLVEYLRVIRANKPNFGMYENVKNIVGKKFKDTFKMFIDELDEYGYNVYWKVLNAKDYGIPQNRERVYLIFIKKELDNGKFKFPEPFDTDIRLKDILEDEVDEKFYLSDKMTEKMKLDFSKMGKNEIDIVGHSGTGGQKGYIHTENGIIGAICATEYKQPKQIIEDNMINMLGLLPIKGNEQVRRVYGTNGISPTLNTMQCGNRQPKIAKFNKLPIKIRKLTPKECFRLQGFSDENFKAAEKMVSNSQLYKQVGNSIVVDVLYYILVELYKAMPYLFDDLRLSSFFSGIGAFEIALNRLYEGINSGNFTKSQVD